MLCKPLYKHLSVALFVGFTANYVPVYLTEILATFLTTPAILIFLAPSAYDLDLTRAKSDLLPSVRTWFLGGLVFGLGMFVRPETPLILVAIFLVYALRWWRKLNWGKLGVAGLWLVLGVLLPLAPWAARNARILGRVRFFSPRYAETIGDVMPPRIVHMEANLDVSFPRRLSLHVNAAIRPNCAQRCSRPRLRFFRGTRPRYIPARTLQSPVRC